MHRVRRDINEVLGVVLLGVEERFEHHVKAKVETLVFPVTDEVEGVLRQGKKIKCDFPI